MLFLESLKRLSTEAIHFYNKESKFIQHIFSSFHSLYSRKNLRTQKIGENSLNLQLKQSGNEVRILNSLKALGNYIQ